MRLHLAGFSGPIAELAATGLTVACGRVERNRGQVVAGTATAILFKYKTTFLIF